MKKEKISLNRSWDKLIQKYGWFSFAGRLEFSVTDGLSKTEEDKIEELFFFGGRGFSILRADDLTRVYDSGDEIERLIAEQYPLVFNSETYPDRPASESPPDIADKRSDNRVGHYISNSFLI